MKHEESSVKIYYTVDYARFRMINGNRQLGERKINNIIKEISGGNDILRYVPILVTEHGDRLDIIDGQHRFYIAKKLKKPIFYVLVQEEKSLPDVAKINSNVEKWNSNDFINCYVQHENEDYKILQKFTDTYGISIGTCLKLLGNGRVMAFGGDSVTLKESFQQGTFKVMHLGYATELIDDCKKFEAFTLWRDRNFIIAIDRIKKAALISIAEVLEAFKKRPEQLTRQAGSKEYVYNLEQIVNVGKQKRILLIAA